MARSYKDLDIKELPTLGRQVDVVDFSGNPADLRDKCLFHAGRAPAATVAAPAPARGLNV